MVVTFFEYTHTSKKIKKTRYPPIFKNLNPVFHSLPFHSNNKDETKQNNKPRK
jgi:hypothetical protein